MASFGWLHSPHWLLQFYAPLAVVWAGCTRAAAGAPDVLPMLVLVGATEGLQQYCCLYLTLALMQRFARRWYSCVCRCWHCLEAGA